MLPAPVPQTFAAMASASRLAMMLWFCPSALHLPAASGEEGEACAAADDSSGTCSLGTSLQRLRDRVGDEVSAVQWSHLVHTAGPTQAGLPNIRCPGGQVCSYAGFDHSEWGQFRFQIESGKQWTRMTFSLETGDDQLELYLPDHTDNGSMHPWKLRVPAGFLKNCETEALLDVHLVETAEALAHWDVTSGPGYVAVTDRTRHAGGPTRIRYSSVPDGEEWRVDVHQQLSATQAVDLTYEYEFLGMQQSQGRPNDVQPPQNLPVISMNASAFSKVILAMGDVEGVTCRQAAAGPLDAMVSHASAGAAKEGALATLDATVSRKTSESSRRRWASPCNQQAFKWVGGGAVLLASGLAACAMIGPGCVPLAVSFSAELASYAGAELVGVGGVSGVVGLACRCLWEDDMSNPRCVWFPDVF